MQKKYDLRPYVAGQTSKSLAAIVDQNRACEDHLKGRYNIEVIDLAKGPQLAKRDQIVALPTLVRAAVTAERISSDMSRKE